jgi:hypothetical protein
MKKTVCLICLGAVVFSCKPPSYSYVPPAMNNIPYSKAGEAHLAAQLGSAFAVRGGIALTKNINLNAWYGGMPSSDSGYKSQETEFSLGVQTNPDDNACFNFYLGIANGKNEKVKTGLSGNYTRSFVQMQFGGFDLGDGGVKFDAYIGTRINYLDYNGTKGTANFDDNLWYYEPFFGGTIGGKNVRLQIMQGVAIKNAGDWGHGVKIFPYFAHIGLLVKIRKGNAAKTTEKNN